MIPILLFSKLAGFLSKNARGVALVVGWALWLGGVIQAGVASLVDVFARFASLDLSAFSGVNFSALQFVGYVNAIIPLSEFVALLAIYLAAWSIVIVIRWIKSFIPTIGN